MIGRWRSFIQSMLMMIYIRRMNLAQLDLNLLVALDALLAEGGVGRAAQRLNLSQPAVSHALRRLREATGDPLLVRVGPRMELTPHAQALRAPLAQALDQVRGLFQAQGFDPATSMRRFRMMMPDLCVDLLMPAVLAQVAAVAPGVRLDVVPWRGPAVLTPDFARTIDLVAAWTGRPIPASIARRSIRIATPWPCGAVIRISTGSRPSKASQPPATWPWSGRASATTPSSPSCARTASSAASPWPCPATCRPCG